MRDRTEQAPAAGYLTQSRFSAMVLTRRYSEPPIGLSVDDDPQRAEYVDAYWRRMEQREQQRAA